MEATGTQVEERPGTHNRLLDLQIDFLKIDLDLTDRVITRMETITQTTKNWAVLIWVATSALVFGQEALRPYGFLVAVPTALFWFIDAWWLHFHRGAFIRQRKIADFLRKGGLERALARGSLGDFEIVDPYGDAYQGSSEYRTATGVLRILLYGELVWLYGGLIAITIAMTFILQG